MKKMIVILPVSIMVLLTVLLLNSEKGMMKNKTGIDPVRNDSLINRGRVLLNRMNFSDQDAEAISAYLRSK